MTRPVFLKVLISRKFIFFIYLLIYLLTLSEFITVLYFAISLKVFEVFSLLLVTTLERFAVSLSY